VLGVVLNILWIRGSICSKVFVYHCIAAEKKRKKGRKKIKEKRRKERIKEKKKKEESEF
jgi:hypothetical protein